MKRTMILGLASLAVWGAASAPAWAQLGVYNRPRVNPYPTVSPYVNMIGTGNPAAAYFGIVRPELQFNQSLNQLQNQYQDLQGTVGQLGTAMQTNQESLITGHPVMFMNYSYYYPLFGGRGAAGGAVGGGMGGGLGGGAGILPTGTGGIRR